MFDDYNNAKHCMIDIETLGVTPGSVIFSIGAVKWYFQTVPYTQSENTPSIVHSEIETMSVNISIEDCLDKGMAVNWNTLGEFWLKKIGVDKLLSLTEDSVNLDNALTKLSAFVKDSQYTWANHDKFDLGLLEHAYELVGIPIPWKFWACQDAATVYNIVGKARKKYLRKEAVALAETQLDDHSSFAHHPLRDALAQTHLLRMCFEDINSNG